MAVYTFEDIKSHVGHNIECVTYGDPVVNVAVECVTCNMVLFDLHPNEYYEKIVEDEDFESKEVKIQWVDNYELLIYEHEHDEDPYTENVKAGQIDDDVTILDMSLVAADLQFGSGNVAFGVNPECFHIIEEERTIKWKKDTELFFFDENDNTVEEKGTAIEGSVEKVVIQKYNQEDNEVCIKYEGTGLSTWVSQDNVEIVQSK